MTLQIRPDPVEIKWRNTPPEHNGTYFMAERPIDYDLAKPIAVSKIEHWGDCGHEEFYEINSGPHRGKRVEELIGAVWYGPIYVPHMSLQQRDAWQAEFEAKLNDGKE